MERKTVTIVGIMFHEEELEEILNYLKEKNVFTKNDQKEFYKKLNKSEEIYFIYREIMNAKQINDYPVMEIVDSSMVDEYFLGYRIKEEPIEIPTNPKILEQIKKAEENWFKLFGEKPLTQSVSFDIY
jgi:predicted nucleic acid-binding protein